MVKSKSRKPKRVSVALRASSKKEPTKAEVTRLGYMLRTLGGMGGTALGGMLGMGAAGGNLGTGLGAALSKWLGSGDYVVTSNSITQRAAAGQIPSMHQQGQSIVVRHKEFLTEVRGNTAFTIRNEYSLNPGISTTFPWLSGIASQYSEYAVKGMVFHYIPTSGSIATASPALGTVMLQTSYRASEPAPASKVEMLNEYWSSEAKPSEEFCHPIECNPKENPFNIQYVRSGALSTTENLLMYDLGTTRVAVSGQQANDQVLGDLWVTYEIELKKPVVANLTNADIQTFTGFATSGITSTNTFGTNFATVFNSFVGTFSFGTNFITFPRGTVGFFQLTFYVKSVSASSGFSPGFTNCSVVQAINGVNSVSSDYSVGTGQCVSTVYISITNPDLAATVITGYTTLAGPTEMRLLITEFNGVARCP